MDRFRQRQLGAYVRTAVRRAQDQRGVDVARERRAGKAGSRRRRPPGRARRSRRPSGCARPRALPVAITRSIGKPWSRRLRRRAASCSRSSADTQTRSKPASWRRWQASRAPCDRRHRRPELLVEVAPEVQAPLLVEPLDLPAVDRPVGERVALDRPTAERPRPGAGVAQVEIEQDAVGVEGDQRARHARHSSERASGCAVARDDAPWRPLETGRPCPIIAC